MTFLGAGVSVRPVVPGPVLDFGALRQSTHAESSTCWDRIGLIGHKKKKTKQCGHFVVSNSDVFGAPWQHKLQLGLLPSTRAGDRDSNSTTHVQYSMTLGSWQAGGWWCCGVQDDVSGREKVSDKTAAAAADGALSLSLSLPATSPPVHL